MHHQACERFNAGNGTTRDYDLHSRLSIVRAEIDMIETQIASLDSATMRDVRDVIRARARRRTFFSADLFADPAWDILLELYACSDTQRQLSVSKLLFAIEVPQTTGLRWIANLEKEGLVIRTPDVMDKRRIYVRLSDEGFQKMNAYFADILPA